jgi:peptidoglycan hydrolase-like protein with peptidoglycan-binding domain
MGQLGGNYGHAVDIRLYSGMTWAKFVPVAKEYGVCQTVFRPQYEPWHYQWRNSNGIFQAPAMKGEKSESKSVKKTKVDLNGVAAAIAKLGEQVARRPLRRGSRNSAVKVVQERLASKGYRCGFPDGIWGRQTDKAFRQFQRDNGLVCDAICGPLSWAKLIS